jgi:hypothetical protein
VGLVRLRNFDRSALWILWRVIDKLPRTPFGANVRIADQSDREISTLPIRRTPAVISAGLFIHNAPMLASSRVSSWAAG